MATPPVGRRRRRWLFRGVLCAGSLLLTAGIAELVVRGVDGWRLFSPRLQPAGFRGDVPIDLPPELVRPFLDQPGARHALLDPAWFARTPALVPERPMPPTMAAQFAGGFHVLFLYDWNEVLLRSVWQKGIGPALAPGVTKPDRYFTFQPVDGSPLPRYRFPPSVTLPSGITLNEFGCRGRDLAVDKPPRTIRIACVGASTTVDDHRSAHSYPELLEGFLSAWAEAHHPGLRVEVLNAGCDGYLSSETVWNVRHVVLPLAVDYVV